MARVGEPRNTMTVRGHRPRSLKLTVGRCHFRTLLTIAFVLVAIFMVLHYNGNQIDSKARRRLFVHAAKPYKSLPMSRQRMNRLLKLNEANKSPVKEGKSDTSTKKITEQKKLKSVIKPSTATSARLKQENSEYAQKENPIKKLSDSNKGFVLDTKRLGNIGSSNKSLGSRTGTGHGNTSISIQKYTNKRSEDLNKLLKQWVNNTKKGKTSAPESQSGFTSGKQQVYKMDAIKPKIPITNVVNSSSKSSATKSEVLKYSGVTKNSSKIEGTSLGGKLTKTNQSKLPLNSKPTSFGQGTGNVILKNKMIV